MKHIFINEEVSNINDAGSAKLNHNTDLFQDLHRILNIWAMIFKGVSGHHDYYDYYPVIFYTSRLPSEIIYILQCCRGSFCIHHEQAVYKSLYTHFFFFFSQKRNAKSASGATNQQNVWNEKWACRATGPQSRA